MWTCDHVKDKEAYLYVDIRLEENTPHLWPTFTPERTAEKTRTPFLDSEWRHSTHAHIPWLVVA